VTAVPRLVDSHCHLNADRFEGDADLVLGGARLAGVERILVPGWNVGNPLRAGWNGTRGLSQRVSFTNRYGALLHGTVYRPKPGARDPYTGQVLQGPFPGAVITEGSVQGSEGMYRWLAQDLAERGYVVLTYDVQGQGGGERPASAARRRMLHPPAERPALRRPVLEPGLQLAAHPAPEQRMPGRQQRREQGEAEQAA